jgi:translation initiation factor 2 beta subunit (eIF-2beta)/eIF-5
LGRTFDETLTAYNNFGDDKNPDRLFKIIYHLGKVSNEDYKQIREREVHLVQFLKKELDTTILEKNGLLM